MGGGARQNRFSLIELLIVIAIMAILSSLLLPALSKAKGTAQQIHCASNMKTMGQLFSMYSNDYDNYLIPPRVPPDKMWGQLVVNMTGLIPNSLLWCPSRDPSKLANVNHGSGYDYGVNYYIASVPATNVWGRLDKVRQPSRTGYLFESGGNYQTNLERLQLPQFSKDGWRHGGNTWAGARSNALFIDIHVEALGSGDIPASSNDFPFNEPVEYFIGIGR